MNNFQFALLCIVIIVIHLKSTEFVYNTGSNFYKCKDYEIWDIIHSKFDISYSKYNYTKNWYLLLFLIPIILNIKNISTSFIYEFVIKFLILIFLRSLTITTTILPKNTHVEVKPNKYVNLSLFDKTIGGGCYDKIYSGHAAFGLLLTLLLFKYNFLESNTFNIILFALINLLHFFIIIVTRAHYTVDVIIAVFMTLWINDIKILI